MLLEQDFTENGSNKKGEKHLSRATPLRINPAELKLLSVGAYLPLSLLNIPYYAQFRHVFPDIVTTVWHCIEKKPYINPKLLPHCL